ncbi:DNA-binding response regulator, NarL/FixJ family, contains REC and HTH domains [Tenacibaculum sp. MAR_2009_124]|uniref:DNA-binding response regulator n=1 Tax=Tenacibaculum sp. MAR_2009_124 TaxID=1250059 RepID=UPI0008999727|nr:response regulator transcription factor [Tenacibaculum sp. MAR_2009_124]SEB44909.1 DNA-binding response regulator, NarL/FixJ family, contains REC and HTH domains [Tenacibaculum sp. MAR_2009_124]
MFQKVLIAEDTDYMSSGIKIALESFQIPQIEYAQYCDEAYLKLKKAWLNEEPYDLLISDLSFVDNYSPQNLTTGEELIEKAKELQPNLKTIVFSIEDKPYRIQHLCKELMVNAYVWKSIHGQKELKRAINSVYGNDFFITPKLAHSLRTIETFEITEYDVSLLKHLAEGKDQREISIDFKERKMKPSSISSVEKRLKILKENFNASNPTQLIAITKDFGLI